MGYSMVTAIKPGRRDGTRPHYIPTRDWSGVLVIHRGLSVIVCGHVIDLTYDDGQQIATIVVKPKKPVDGAVSVEDTETITQAAKLLAHRAQRFLGKSWTVVEWTPPGSDRVAGDYVKGSGV